MIPEMNDAADLARHAPMMHGRKAHDLVGVPGD